MEFETYADVIDSYNSGVGVEAGETLTDYIKGITYKSKKSTWIPLAILKKF